MLYRHTCVVIKVAMKRNHEPWKTNLIVLTLTFFLSDFKAQPPIGKFRFCFLYLFGISNDNNHYYICASTQETEQWRAPFNAIIKAAAAAASETGDRASESGESTKAAPFNAETDAGEILVWFHLP